jgi:acylphosphatase
MAGRETRAATSETGRKGPAAERLGVEIQGLVQGVGFRPFVYRLATDLALTGWVLNDTRGVFIEVEGPRAALESFLARLPREAGAGRLRRLRDPPQRRARREDRARAARDRHLRGVPRRRA